MDGLKTEGIILIQLKRLRKIDINAKLPLEIEVYARPDILVSQLTLMIVIAGKVERGLPAHHHTILRVKVVAGIKGEPPEIYPAHKSSIGFEVLPIVVVVEMIRPTPGVAGEVHLYGVISVALPIYLLRDRTHLQLLSIRAQSLKI